MTARLPSEAVVRGPTLVVLASASKTRARLLAAAGLEFIVAPARADEARLKDALALKGVDAAEAARALAELKAQWLSAERPEALVIGCDQLLDCDGRWFDKPADAAAARRQLLALRGRTHRLATAVVVMEGGVRVWQHVAEPRLTMRPFSDGFLDAYLARAGAELCECVGAYRLEALGAQLFTHIEGDYFAILGLPLLPLLAYLRERGVVPA